MKPIEIFNKRAKISGFLDWSEGFNQEINPTRDQVEKSTDIKLNLGRNDDC